MTKWILAAAAVLALAAPEAPAEGINGPFSNHHASPSTTRGRTLPVFQAAPWYLYWPYDGHFLTPAPVYGAFYPPPMMGNYPVQPYFPAPAYGPPAAYPAMPLPVVPLAPPVVPNQ